MIKHLLLGYIQNNGTLQVFSVTARNSDKTYEVNEPALGDWIRDNMLNGVLSIHD